MIVHCYIQRIIKHCTGGSSSVSAVATHSVSGNSGDNAVRAHLPNTVVKLIGNEEIPMIIHRYTPRIRKHCISSRSAVAAVTVSSITCHCCNNPIRTYLADAMVIVIGYKEISLTIYCYFRRHIKLCAGSRAAVSTVTVSSITCRCCNNPIGGYLADAMVISIGYKETSLTIHCNPMRIIKPCACCRAAIAAVTVNSIACHSCDDFADILSVSLAAIAKIQRLTCWVIGMVNVECPC